MMHMPKTFSYNFLQALAAIIAFVLMIFLFFAVYQSSDSAEGDGVNFQTPGLSNGGPGRA
jgi:hypothetical protein